MLLLCGRRAKSSWRRWALAGIRVELCMGGKMKSYAFGGYLRVSLLSCERQAHMSWSGLVLAGISECNVNGKLKTHYFEEHLCAWLLAMFFV